MPCVGDQEKGSKVALHGLRFLLRGGRLLWGRRLRWFLHLSVEQCHWMPLFSLFLTARSTRKPSETIIQALSFWDDDYDYHHCYHYHSISSSMIWSSPLLWWYYHRCRYLSYFVILILMMKLQRVTPNDPWWPLPVGEMPWELEEVLVSGPAWAIHAWFYPWECIHFCSM